MSFTWTSEQLPTIETQSSPAKCEPFSQNTTSCSHRDNSVNGIIDFGNFCDARRANGIFISSSQQQFWTWVTSAIVSVRRYDLVQTLSGQLVAGGFDLISCQEMQANS
jgi:hypothetical protein